MKRALVLILAAGASLATSKAPDTGFDSADVFDCATTAPEECVAAGCVAIEGRLIDEGCVDYTESGEALGCMAVAACTAVELAASSPDDPDTCYVFPSGCLPDGWTECVDAEYGECR